MLAIRPMYVWMAALLCGLPSTVSGADTSPVWRTDFAAAQAEAERDQKPLLIHFYAVWCGPCGKMDREVFKSPEVRQLFADRLVAVKVDSDQHPRLLKQYGIEILPSDVILDPINGRVLVEKQGAQGLKDYLSMAARGDARFQQALALHLAKREDQPLKTEGPDTPEFGPRPTETPVKSQPLAVELGTAQPMVGLDGFSPVGLSKHRQWTRGSAKYAWDYQGVTYQLATREELAEFRRDPEAFAPRLLGCDPVMLWESDRAIPGKTLYGAFFDDELYLFTTAENRKRFKASPQRYLKTQHVLKVDQIDRTALLDGSHLK